MKTGNWRRLGIFLIIGIVLFLVMNFNSRLEELNRIENRRETVAVEATSVVATQKAHMTKLAYATSDAAVQDYARNEAHLGQANDKVVIVLPEPGATPEPTSIPTPIVKIKTPLQEWIEYIFGN